MSWEAFMIERPPIWAVVFHGCRSGDTNFESCAIYRCHDRMTLRLLVTCLGLVAASCDSASTPDAVNSATDEGSSGDVRGFWPGTWSTEDTTLGPNELIPRLFVLDDRVLIIHEQNLGTTVEGEIFDPDTGEATRIASSELVWRANAAMAWTGEELLIVGGSNGPGIDQIGAAYSPTTDSWRPLPDPPYAVDAWEGAITGPAVWTGSEMIIHRAALSFNPATQEWRTIAPLPGPPRSSETAVWTGGELVIWGGCDANEAQCDDFATGILTDGFTYNPITDVWQSMAASPLSPGVHPQGVWTGQEYLIYAGAVAENESTTAAAYDPASDSWRTVANPPISPRRYATPAWTGQYFVLWGGSSIGSGEAVEYNDGAAYDPVADTWLRIPETPGFDERDRHTMVWVRDQLFITGGFETTGPLTFKPETSD